MILPNIYHVEGNGQYKPTPLLQDTQTSMRVRATPFFTLSPTSATHSVTTSSRLYTDASGNASTQTVSHTSHFLPQHLPDTMVEIPADPGGLILRSNPGQLGDENQ